MLAFAGSHESWKEELLLLLQVMTEFYFLKNFSSRNSYFHFSSSLGFILPVPTPKKTKLELYYLLDRELNNIQYTYILPPPLSTLFVQK
jgi:hypothetical protein